MNDQTLIRKIRALARPYYPDEGSHGWNHIQDVLRRAHRMSRDANEPWTPYASAAVMFHDTGLYPEGIDKPEMREGHETRGAEIARKALANVVDRSNLDLIAAAIAEHRGSYKGDYTSPLSDLVSSADRNPVTLEKAVRRSARYNAEHGVTGEQSYKNIASHLSEKYGHGGYARMPEHYQRTYAKALENFRTQMDKLTPEQVKDMLEK